MSTLGIMRGYIRTELREQLMRVVIEYVIANEVRVLRVDVS